MSQLALWNEYMQSYDLLTQIGGYQQSQRDILERAKPLGAAMVLDAGSGTGNLSISLKSEGARVVSCDFSTSAIAVHRAKDPDAVTHELSLEERLPFQSDAFDRVCCASVLFALSQDGCRNAIQEFVRVLKPGGRLIVTVPTRAASVRHLLSLYFTSCLRRYGVLRGSWKSLRGVPALWKIANCNAKLMRMPDWQGFHFFDANELKTLLTDAGLKSCAIEKTYGGGFILATAEKAA
jgi:ubiquinone/menaquinone biosynthesis C-methylase UbiE